FAEQRRRLVAAYDGLIGSCAPLVRPLHREWRSFTAWHIYPVRVDFAHARLERAALMRALYAQGIGTQVHYIPLHKQPYYAQRYGETPLPGAEAYYRSTLTLPLHAGMCENDVERVVGALRQELKL